MKNNMLLKFILVCVGVIAGFFLVKALLGLIVGAFFKILVPLIIIGALGYAGYRYVARSSALPGRNRTPLP